MSKQPSIFDEAINAIRCIVDFQLAPVEVVQSCKDTINILRACDKLSTEILEVWVKQNQANCGGAFAKAVLRARRKKEKS